MSVCLIWKLRMSRCPGMASEGLQWQGGEGPSPETRIIPLSPGSGLTPQVPLAVFHQEKSLQGEGDAEMRVVPKSGYRPLTLFLTRLGSISRS